MSVNSTVINANEMVDLSNSQPKRNTRIQVNFADSSIRVFVDGTQYIVRNVSLTQWISGRLVPVGQRVSTPVKSGWTYKFDVTTDATTLVMIQDKTRTVARWNADKEAHMFA